MPIDRNQMIRYISDGGVGGNKGIRWLQVDQVSDSDAEDVATILGQEKSQITGIYCNAEHLTAKGIAKLAGATGIEALYLSFNSNVHLDITVLQAIARSGISYLVVQRCTLDDASVQVLASCNIDALELIDVIVPNENAIRVMATIPDLTLRQVVFHNEAPVTFQVASDAATSSGGTASDDSYSNNTVKISTPQTRAHKAAASRALQETEETAARDEMRRAEAEAAARAKAEAEAALQAVQPQLAEHTAVSVIGNHAAVEECQCILA